MVETRNRIIIAGGRDFDNMPFLVEAMNTVLNTLYDSQPEIVSGGARGADRCGEVYAKANGLHCRKFPANWQQFGKSAGYIRNQEMAKYADVLVAFWDGKSKGTNHMINIARRQGLKVFVYNY